MNYRLATIDDFQEIIGIYRSAIDTMNANGIMQWDEIYPTVDDIRKDIDTQEMYVGLKDSRICVAYTLNKESDAQYQNRCTSSLCGSRISASAYCERYHATYP